MKKIVILAFLLLINFTIKAQVSPIGSTKAVENLMNHPISYSTGLPQIQIPLLSIEFGGMEIPIALSYHAGGLKMNQKSGLVGAGWSISTNFQISRTVRGREDEYYAMPNLDSMYLEETHDRFSSLPSNSFDNSSLRDAYLTKFIFPDPARDGSSPYIYHPDLYTTEYYDSEMDIFRYNLFNTSGRFVFTSRNPYQITALDDSFYGSELKFFKPVSDYNYFTAKDEQGTEYEFGKDMIQYVYSGSAEVTTAWMLKSAKALNGDTISFGYYQPFPSEKRFGKTVKIKEGCYQCFPYNESISNYVQSDSSGVTYGQDQIPADITFPEGTVTYGYQYMTIGGVSESLINEISLRDLDNNLIRKVDLYYTQGLRFAFLDSVKVSGGTEQPMVYRFTYQMRDENNVLFDDLDLGADITGYLKKRENNIVRKTSIPFDHYLSFEPILDPQYGLYEDLDYYVPDMEFDSKNTNYTTPPIYLLKEIKYPQGGTTSYVFENQVISMGISLLGHAAGYRIKEIISNDGISGQSQRKTYTYGDNDDDGPQSFGPIGTGYLLNYAEILNGANSIRQGAEIGVMPDYVGDPLNWILYNTFNFSNQYMGNLDFAGLQENPVYYRKVTERNYNGSVAISKNEFVFDSLINVIKPNATIFERNLYPNVVGRGTMTRVYKPENFSGIFLGYNPKLISMTGYQMIQSTWKKALKEEFTYTSVDVENLMGGMKNVKIRNYALMTPDYSGSLTLQDIYTHTNIESVFDFNVYSIYAYPNRKLTERTVTKYTE